MTPNRKENRQSVFKHPASYGKGMIMTHSGIFVDLITPKPEMIILSDISHALSHLCRFGGHTNGMITVAQHSMAVAGFVPDEYKLVALMHDATEAYIGDLTAPIKNMMPQYKMIEEGLIRVIAEKFNFEYPFPKIVKLADDRALCMEWDAFMVGKDKLPFNPIQIATEFEMAYRVAKGYTRKGFNGQIVNA